MLQQITGGVCAARGFRAAGLHVGVKTHNVNKKDVALIVSNTDCAAAAVFTKNVVKAAPIHVTKAHLADGKARAIIANSGNANACAPQGEENAERMCAAAAKAVGCRAEDVLVSSTGVIGQTLNVEAIEKGMPELARRWSFWAKRTSPAEAEQELKTWIFRSGSSSRNICLACQALLCEPLSRAESVTT